MRLEPSILNGIDDWRKGEGDAPSRAEAVRRLIEAGLAAMKSTQPKISDGEKLSLLMLCQISKKLEVTDEIDPDFIESVIYGGHYWGLRWKYSGIFHGHTDKDRVVSEVVDILDMWDFLELGFKKLSKADKKQLVEKKLLFSEDFTFPGFDHNNESEYVGVATFLIEKLERFSGFKERAHLNSHRPTLSQYCSMLRVFLPIRKTLVGRGGLSLSHYVAILSGRRAAEPIKE